MQTPSDHICIKSATSITCFTSIPVSPLLFHSYSSFLLTTPYPFIHACSYLSPVNISHLLMIVVVVPSPAFRIALSHHVCPHLLYLSQAYVSTVSPDSMMRMQARGMNEAARCARDPALLAAMLYDAVEWVIWRGSLLSPFVPRFVPPADPDVAWADKCRL